MNNIKARARSLGTRRLGWILGSLVLIGGSSQGSVSAEEGPRFTNPRAITNPLWPFVAERIRVDSPQPLVPGEREVRRFVDDSHAVVWRGEVVDCSVLRSETIEDGKVVGTSECYLAQSDDGTVYVFGERSDGMDDGEDDDDDWVVGGELPSVIGAPRGGDRLLLLPDPIVLMPAAPGLGDAWHSEVLPLGEEIATVIAVGQTTRTRAGLFEDCIVVREHSLSEDDIELKWFAPGVGWVKTLSGDGIEMVEVVARVPRSAELRCLHDGDADLASVEIAVEADEGLSHFYVVGPDGGPAAGFESRIGKDLPFQHRRFQLETPRTTVGVLRDSYVEGRYRLFGRGVETGVPIYEELELHHAVPAAPRITYPSTGTTSEALRAPGITWLPTGDVDGYQLRLTEESGRSQLVVDLPAETTFFPFPDWLRSGADYHLEVRALNASGNAAMSGLRFRMAP